MSDYHYVIPSRDEVLTLAMTSLLFGFMFGVIFARFDSTATLFNATVNFFVFLFILFYTRLVVMKFFGLRNAFEMHIDFSKFDRFGFRKYDKVSAFEKKWEKRLVGGSIEIAKSVGAVKKAEYHKSDFLKKGFPVIFLSILFYMLSLGMIVYPSVFKYKIKKIPHLFLGTQQMFENDLLFYYNMEISDYRISKALFMGFFYYFVFGMILKLFYYGSFYYWWFLLILFWIAFVTLMPIPASEGFELMRKNRFAWVCTFTILVLGMIGLLAFESYEYMIGVMIFSFLVIMFVHLWKKIM